MTNPNSAQELQREYYSETAEQYDRLHPRVYDDEHEVALGHVSDFIRSLGVDSVLDVGAGTGRAHRYFREHHPGVQIQGIEPSEALIDIAVKTHGIAPSQIKPGSGAELPYANGSFDAVMEFGVLHHVPDPNVVIREMMRVAQRAVFISDSNRFGQGARHKRWTKLALWKAGLWRPYDWVRTRGRRYHLSDGDGVFYSYSVYDSLDLLQGWADRVLLIPTVEPCARSWLHPLLTSRNVLVCALKGARPE